MTSFIRTLVCATSCFATLTLSGTAHSQGTAIVDALRQSGNDPMVFGQLQVRASLAHDAFMSANAHLQGNKLPMLYCLPSNLAMTPDQLIQIVRSAIDKNSKLGQLPMDNFSTVLLITMQRTFPC